MPLSARLAFSDGSSGVSGAGSFFSGEGVGCSVLADTFELLLLLVAEREWTKEWPPGADEVDSGMVTVPPTA